MKKILFIIITLCIFFPLTSKAFDYNKCWTEKKCIDYRKDFFKLNPSEAKEGFVINPETMATCQTNESGYNEFLKEKYGYCLASSITRTKISIGDRNTFNDIADFIAYIYKYAFIISGIVAVIMIIFSGINWIISAGNTNTIEQSKKRITGAAIGVILLASAYTILNTINPYLVNFRPLNNYMINDRPLVTFCDELGEEVTLNEVVNDGKPVSPQNALCGKNYFINNDKSYNCTGNFCAEDGRTCSYETLKATSTSCIEANISGVIVNSDIDYVIRQLTSYIDWGEGFEWKWANKPEIYYVCADGTFDDLTTSSNDPDNDFNETKKIQYYRVKLNNKKLNPENFCNGKLKGFLLSLNLNENMDPIHERHMVGITDCNGHVCSGVDLGDMERDILKKTAKGYFITWEQLKKGIIINVNMGNFNDIDSSDERKAYEFLYN
jgi:hypothetical protein